MAAGQLAITPREAYATLGDDWAQALTLWDNGAVRDVSSASAIKAAVFDLAGNQIIAATSCVSGAAGASWSTGVVVLPFTAAQTAVLFPIGEYSIVLQVTISGARTTWPLVPAFVQYGILP